MITFTLNPDENQIISLLVPARDVGVAGLSFSVRFLLTGYDAAWEGKAPQLFHDLPPATAVFLETEPPATDLSREAVEHILVWAEMEKIRTSFKALFGRSLPDAAVLTPSADNGMVVGAKLVKEYFQQAPLPPAGFFEPIEGQPLKAMTTLVGPRSLVFRRLLPLGRELQVDMNALG